MAQALSPSHGAPDVSVSVANLVSRFNTLKVADTDEDAAAKQAKALKKLDAALRRAEIAREEAESEVRGLRKETKGLRALAEERERETDAVRTRCEDFEVSSSFFLFPFFFLSFFLFFFFFSFPPFFSFFPFPLFP